MVSGCVTIPNTRQCQVSGVLDAGMICAENLTGIKSEMNLEQVIEFLEPQSLPSPRAGAICMSPDDFNAMKTALEQACRDLGERCSKQIQLALH